MRGTVALCPVLQPALVSPMLFYTQQSRSDVFFFFFFTRQQQFKFKDKKKQAGNVAIMNYNPIILIHNVRDTPTSIVSFMINGTNMIYCLLTNSLGINGGIFESMHLIFYLFMYY